MGRGGARRRAQRIAASTGAPVAREVLFDPSCAYLDGRIVGLFEFLPGRHPASTLTSPAAIQRFFTSLGRAVAALHSHRCDGFSSRVGGVYPGSPIGPVAVEGFCSMDTFLGRGAGWPEGEPRWPGVTNPTERSLPAAGS